MREVDFEVLEVEREEGGIGTAESEGGGAQSQAKGAKF